MGRGTDRQGQTSTTRFNPLYGQHPLRRRGTHDQPAVTADADPVAPPGPSLAGQLAVQRDADGGKGYTVILQMDGGRTKHMGRFTSLADAERFIFRMRK